MRDHTKNAFGLAIQVRTSRRSGRRSPRSARATAGRKPCDMILNFKIVVPQSFHNLSDENSKEENKTINAGKTPEGWEKQPAKNAQKDKDGRWTKETEESDRHRAGEVQNWDDEPQHPPAGLARAGGGCARLSALTDAIHVASAEEPRGRSPGVQTVLDRDSPRRERCNRSPS